MEETIIISNGSGLIDIRQGNIETVVYLNDEAISIGWNDCGGSVAQYLAGWFYPMKRIKEFLSI